jgi:hypothetical protein
MRVSGVPYEVDEPSEYTMEFEFIYKGPNYKDTNILTNSNQKKIVVSDCASWDEVLEQFVSFLGNCYGYDLKDEVEYTTIDDRVQRARDQLKEKYE